MSLHNTYPDALLGKSFFQLGGSGLLFINIFIFINIYLLFLIIFNGIVASEREQTLVAECWINPTLRHKTMEGPNSHRKRERGPNMEHTL